MIFDFRRHITPILTAIAVVFSLTGCSTDTDTPESDAAVVRLAFFAEGQPGLMRTLSAANWSAVNNLAVCIYDNGGNAIGYKREDSPTEVSSGLYEMDVNTHKATGCNIYASANIAAGLFSDGSKLTAVKDKKLTRTALTDLAADTEVPMIGVYGSTVNITGGTQTIGNVELKRICSQIEFNITAATGITLNSFQLCHLPLGSYYIEREPADWTAPATYADFSEVTVTSSTTFPQTYFVYENLTGSATGLTAETDRYTANAPTGASYLLVNATGPGWKTVFRIYLGGVNLDGTTNYNDFNVFRNCHYTMNIQINGASSTDLRIDKSIEPLSLTTTINDWGGTTVTPGVGN